MTEYTYLDTPIGRLLLSGNEGLLTGLHFSAGSKAQGPEAIWREDAASFAEVIGQLEGYFAGNLTEFALPLAPTGTDFQLAVWKALGGIPYGATISYGALAKQIGRPGAARAVGLANGANPIAIIQPCHRVIGSNGSLTGFGGGVDVKQRLLDLERGGQTLF